MPDQADGLRELVRARAGVAVAEAPAPRGPGAPARTRSLVFTSGKGGVGTSNLTLNLAIALGEIDRRVLLVDADLGLANLDLLCGRTPAHDLGDVLNGNLTLDEAITEGPNGIRLLPGAHGMRTLPEALAAGAGHIASALAGLESGSDYLLIDAGSGLGPGISTIAAAADEVVVVTTPEPTSLADAHAAVASLRRVPGLTIRVAVTQAASALEADDVLDRFQATCRQFLGAVVTPLGHVRYDSHVPVAVRAGTPFTIEYPSCPASADVRRLARRLVDGPASRATRPGFFARLAARWALGRVAK